VSFGHELTVDRDPDEYLMASIVEDEQTSGGFVGTSGRHVLAKLPGWNAERVSGISSLSVLRQVHSARRDHETKVSLRVIFEAKDPENPTHLQDSRLFDLEVASAVP